MRRSTISPSASPSSLSSEISNTKEMSPFSSSSPSRMANFTSRWLFSDFTAEEEVLQPPPRPSSVPPFLDLEGHDVLRVEGHHQEGEYSLAQYHTNVLRQMLSSFPSEESFQCCGLESEQVETNSEPSQDTFVKQLHCRPNNFSLLASTHLQSYSPSLLYQDNDLNTPSESSLYSPNTPLDVDSGSSSYFPGVNNWDRHARRFTENPTKDHLFCPPSPSNKF
ncbi:hypothetical protein CBS101457_002125 [Exobasidium rhododendri]|nr:hypothetical protein CBS101457_002125 [Exobasidium rhododendri]